MLASGAFLGAGAAPAEAASLPPGLQFTLVTGGLTDPVFVANAGDGSNRLFIVQQTGQIRVYKSGSLLSTPFLNIVGSVSDFTGVNGEQGLLAVAFDPGYSTNGYFYITYTTHTSDPVFAYTTTLARYRVSTTNPDQADPSTGRVLLSIPKKHTNHNGGMLAFGPDGYLYMSMGDGGSGGDPDGNAQNLHTLLGKLLRLDVNATPAPGQTYVIPPGNPLYNSADPSVRKEIWAYGLRNPWRFSFDRSAGSLYIGDVGQNAEEEVDFQAAATPGGQNYGWNVLEGNLCYSPSTNCTAPAGYVAPVATYDHGTNDSYGCSITGGYVYRGSLYSLLAGVYFYGDFCSGKVLGLIKNPDNSWTSGLMAATGFAISSFGEDESGELYLADYGGGRIYRIAAACAGATVDVRIAGSLIDAYCLSSGDSVRATYANVQNGPLEVHSTSNVFASERSFFGPYSSFNEVMAYPNNRLTTHYWFPWYDGKDMMTWVMVGNPSATNVAHVTIKIAGMVAGRYTIAPLGNAALTYAGIQNGPVEVLSDISVFTSERTLLGYPDGSQSFNEVLGYPHNQLTTHYWFPWYDSKDMMTWVLVGNPSSTKTASVTIKIGGSTVGTYRIPPLGNITPTFANVQNGPVEVLSNISIFTSERTLFGSSPYWTFNEVMGYPHIQLTTNYWLPWYDNSSMTTWILVGNPSGSATAHVTIKIAGATVGTYSIPPFGNVTPTFSLVPAGPVQILSDISVFASERALNGYPGAAPSFNEMMAIANNRLAAAYWFPWYDNRDMLTELVITRP
jgi:glucose/arabinose dehydrogenase